jgi:hypothetical protein
MDTGGGITSIIPMTHTTTTTDRAAILAGASDADLVRWATWCASNGEAAGERMAAIMEESAKRADQRIAASRRWSDGRPARGHRCTGCGGRGRADNPLLHGRLGYAHNGCDWS